MSDIRWLTELILQQITAEQTQALEGLIREMDEKLRYPGMPNIWWMPIQTRTEMLATGVMPDEGTGHA